MRNCTDISDNQESYQFCQRESNSWCKYWQSGGSGNHKSSANLPKVIKDLLMLIFLNLQDDNSLSRCLEATTQNPKDAFNKIIWKKCSKYVLEIGLASAAINLNDGVVGLGRVFQSLDLLFGKYAKEGEVEKDMNGIIKNEQKDTRST